MNAAQEHTQLSPATSPQEALDLPLSALSALADGEPLTDEEWAQCLATSDGDEAESTERWACYHMIGDVLRGSDQVLGAQNPTDFLAGVRHRLAAEAALPQPAVPEAAPLTLPPASALPVAGHVRAPAANDAVFRWKMVAGFASLAAVMAVSWTLLGTAPGGAGGVTGGGQMAVLNSPAASAPVPVAVATPPTTVGQEVLVNTPQGLLIRDAQLEERLAEHRQYGGMSALQMPAGFLRNATYDAPGR